MKPIVHIVPIVIRRMFSVVLCAFSVALCVSAQSEFGQYATPQNVGFRVTSATPLDADLVWLRLSDTTVIPMKFDGLMRYFKDVKQYWWYNGSRWKQFDTGGGSDAYDGNFITTSVPQPGVNYGGETVQEFLDAVFKQSTAPQCNITVNTPVREFQTAGNISVQLNWSVTRPVGCNEIVSIIVDGQVVTPNGGNQSGDLFVIVPANTNRTFTIQVSSTDKSASASASLSFLWKLYWGNFINQNPANVDILELSGAGVGAGNELATGFAKTYDGINGAGFYLVFAFPDAWGIPEFFVNGLINTAYTKRVITFTNASGGQTAYQVWVSNTAQNSPITQFVIR